MNNPAIILNLTYRAAALAPPVRFVPDNIIKMAGEGIAWKTTCFHEVVNSLAGEALSSHEALPGCGSATKSTGDVQGALEFGSRGASNVRVDPIVFKMTMARIAAPAVESRE